MEILVYALVELFRNMDAGQTAHVASAATAVYFGRRGTPAERVVMWALCAAVYLGLAAAGFLFGKWDWPTSLSVGSDPLVYRPMEGMELRSVDHAIESLLGMAFLAAAGVVAVSSGLARTSATRLAARLSRLLGAGPEPAAAETASPLEPGPTARVRS